MSFEPLAQAQVGTMQDGTLKPSYLISGQEIGVSRALSELGFIFNYVKEDGTLVFRNTNYQTAWYNRVQDHNPEGDSSL